MATCKKCGGYAIEETSGSQVDGIQSTTVIAYCEEESCHAVIATVTTVDTRTNTLLKRVEDV